ncbi:RnfABCDGE type electron transport complex subunit D [Guggenheimella bovis]
MVKHFGIPFLKQANMRTVLLALTPLLLFGIYLFGLRVLVLFLVNMLVAVLIEYAFFKGKKPVSEAAIVTALLYTLTLPASVPLWISVTGIAFGMFFGKMVYGGFGRNVYNPALVGRAFVYISFSTFLTASWSEHLKAFPAGFGRYLSDSIEVVSTATPMLSMQSEGKASQLLDLFLGFVNGSIGETSKLLILLALVFLFFKKVIFKENVIGMFLGFSITTLALRALGLPVNSLDFGLLSGGFLFGMTFMMTDPISSAKTPWGRYLSSGIAGIVTVIIRSFAIFPGGVMFAILIANTFAPILDELVRFMESRRKHEKEA